MSLFLCPIYLLKLPAIIIDPCITESWEGLKIKRGFRGNTYHIEVKNPERVSKVVKQLLLKGNSIDGNLIPLNKSQTVNQVVVRMG